MEAVKNGMQHNLLLESGIQFVPCSPFIALECILSTNGECGIDFHAALLRNCLYSPIQRSPTEERRVSLFCIHHCNQNIDLVFGNAFPVFVVCDSGGYSILIDSYFGIIMLL